MKCYDRATLCVKSGVATAEEVVAALEQILQEVNTVLEYKIECKFQVNMVSFYSDGQSHKTGYGYVRVSNPEMYHILCGRDPDGRIRKAESMYTKEQLAKYGQGYNWADLEDEVEWIQLEPLFTAPTIDMSSPMRKVELWNILCSDAARKGLSIQESDRQMIQDTYKLSFIPAHIKHDDINPQTIIICKLPSFVSETHLKEWFRPYASDSDTTVTRHVHNEVTTDTYPLVSIRENTGYVSFNPSSHDAQFALLMTRKYKVVDPETQTEYVLSCNQFLKVRK